MRPLTHRLAGSLVPLALTLAAFATAAIQAADVAPGLSFEQLAALRTVRQVEMSPDGEWVAYTLTVPRRPGVDDDGPAWTELHVVPASGGPSTGYVTGEVNVSAVRFTPDGELITYLAKRHDDKHGALWAIPLSGGESRKLLELKSDIRGYRVSPDGTKVALIAEQPVAKERKRAEKKGYSQQVFEEDWLPRKLWIAPMPAFVEPVPDPAAEVAEETKPRALDIDGSVFALDWNPDGQRIALAVAPRPLIDDSYMFRRVQVFDAESGERLALLENPGKLGDVAFSPDGDHVAMISAADPNDPADGRLMVAPSNGGPLRDLIPGLQGHVNAIAWRSADTIQFVADVGVETKLGVVTTVGGAPSWAIQSGPSADGSGRVPVLSGLSLSQNGLHAAFAGETPTHPREVYVMGPGDESPRRVTDSNPWLAGVGLATQEVVTWTSKDSLGLELQGILIRPLKNSLGDPPPLIMTVHGGPEGHVRNGWNSSYSRPGQLAAGEGFAVFYPNYRGSTGRGVEFSKLGQSDAAGKEFDDLVEGVDYLVAQGLADADRVGIHGGSYGGYATAWCATRYTEKFRAGVMFVGISNKLSKALTTEIPIEDQMVHTRYDPWTRFEFSLERSPLSYVDQGRTPLLIAGGTSDTRVHPSQSLQLYRALKLVGKTPVRYVRYPGEGHGNRRAASRDDYSRRLMRWMRHFLVEGATELPPWNLGLGEEETEDEEDDED